MILRVIAEIVLLILSFIGGTQFWQMIKRDKFMKKCLHDQNFLDSFVLHLKNDNFLTKQATQVSVTGAMYTSDYEQNIWLEFSSSISSINKVKYIAVSLILAILVGSYFLGLYFLVANLALIVIIGFFPVTESAKDNVYQDLIAIIWNFNKLFESDKLKCQNLLNKTTVLNLIYKSLEKIH